MGLPELPNAHALAALALTALALFLFTRERIPLETSSLFVLVALATGFALFPYHDPQGRVLEPASLFSGFGHEALVAVVSLMVVGEGIVRTGALEPVARLLARAWAAAPALSLLATLVVAAALSAFVNNTPVVVLLLPILVGVALRSGRPASGILLPVGLATLVGGMATTIGTSTNLLVVSVAREMGVRPFGMFDFSLPAAAAGAVGLLYLWLVAPRLLPRRELPIGDCSPRVFAAELLLPEDAPVVGERLGDAVARTDGRMRVRRIRRGEDAFVVPMPDVRLRPGDRLLVSDRPDRLKEFEAALGARLHSGDTPVDEAHPLRAGDQRLAEVVVVQGSEVLGTSLRRLRFLDRHNLLVLAVHRAGRDLLGAGRDLADIRLRAGDVLLVQGAEADIAALREVPGLLVLDTAMDLPRSDKAPLALAITALTVGLAAADILPIAVSAPLGGLLMVTAGCLDWRDAAEAVSAQVVLIVASSLALGTALVETGAARYLSEVLVAVTAGASPRVVLAGLMLLMALLTNVVSNNAAAVIGTPIAVETARQLGLPPEAFVLAVLFGANMSYATPMAYKTNLLVMSAGGYRFSDFLRAGLPLTLLMWAALGMILPHLYGF
ncbi:SLC13 family permease [Inmirania thermothiophila]|uniref:Di/tricarboxylate transporter n=1 Tax=Inmirania thermothiophila TaxID=1750597 RepID=A0A3N1Y833_9GAMM|nr:SLC13 family permease [Inmirania thermothiophila]ROR34986.1 di/tricarboxylate transporter [Inmirania thermothiophila]